ncbi:MAG: hydroxyacid dehydrogenase [Bacteroidales bacterium]|jgi:D-3-phosphoglycerate dehydrogenase|nr:hydroxyacid dehydrogenase [Bacteroidales bacterium]
MNIVAIEPLGMDKSLVTLYQQYFEKRGHKFTCFLDRTENKDEIICRMQNAEIVLVSNLPMTREILSVLPKLKMLAVAFAGVDHVDLDFCQEKNIIVKNTPDYSTIAVAELTVGLMIHLYRSLLDMGNKARTGGTRGDHLGLELHEKTVGIIGTGRIGSRVARYMLAFGSKVIAWNRSPHLELQDLGVEYVSLDKLLRAADILSLHLPLTTETTGLLSAERISLCKPSAVLINTARGRLTDMEAIAHALHSHRLAGAAFDVFEKEPPLPKNHPLLNAPNCVVLPHVGYATREAFQRRIDALMKNVESFIPPLS